MNEDFLDFLGALLDHEVEFVVVGAHAMAANGIPRATVDLDVLVRPTAANGPRVVQALRAFGAPLGAHAVTAQDFAREGTVYQMGLPPRRIDVTTHIDGLSYEQATSEVVQREIGGRAVPFLGLPGLVKNKSMTGRAKDQADIALFREAGVDVDALLED